MTGAMNDMKRASSLFFQAGQKAKLYVDDIASRPQNTVELFGLLAQLALLSDCEFQAVAHVTIDLLSAKEAGARQQSLAALQAEIAAQLKARGARP